MVKKVQKKQKKKKIKKKKDTLPPGKKKCKSCNEIMPIHRKICLQCGHVHEMKRMKDDIMKNLKKITPTIIKSIIENEDFNQFKGWRDETIYEFSDLDIYSNDEIAFKNWRGFKKTNHREFEYFIFDNSIACLCSTKNNLLFIESLHKEPIGLTQNENLTIKAYDLQNFHCAGVNYKGDCLLRILTQNNLDTIYIDRHVEKMKSFANLVAMMTGQATIIILTLPVGLVRKNKENLTFKLNRTLEIMEQPPDRITAFEWLKATASTEGISLVVGTLLGNISVYRIGNGQYHLERFIPRAHFEMVTCLSECPLNDEKNVVFASGCYVGTVMIWNLREKTKLYSLNSSNRKIWNLVWDPGAKFLLIVKDENSESCILACFYAINKIETTVHMANCLEIRTVKNSKSKYITNHDPRSKDIPILDPVRGNLKFLCLEELRGKSLKKKKPKEEIVQKYIHFNFQDKILKIGEEPEDDKEEEMIIEKKFPLYSDLVNIQRDEEQYTFVACYSGLLIKHLRK